MVRVLSAVRGPFVSLSKCSLVDFTVRIILKEMSFSPMPLTLSQEPQALLCFHLTGKPIDKRKFSKKEILAKGNWQKEIFSCSYWWNLPCWLFSQLGALRESPQVLTKTAASFVTECIVSHESGSCWAPALQSFHRWQESPTLQCLGRRALCKASQESHQKVQSLKIKLEH